MHLWHVLPEHTYDGVIAAPLNNNNQFTLSLTDLRIPTLIFIRVYNKYVGTMSCSRACLMVEIRKNISQFKGQTCVDPLPS